VSGDAELTAEVLAGHIRRMGIAPGEMLLVHSSLKGIGWMPGGPEELVHAFQEVLTPDGTLLMPAFTYGRETFRVGATPAATGLLSETFRTTGGVVRSWHPTHSISAWGKDAEALCADHHLREPFGADSPLDRFVDAGGRILLLGVTHTASSTVHVGECRAKLPYISVPSTRHQPVHEFIAPDGRKHRTTITQFAGHGGAFNAVERDLRLRGAIRDGRIGAKQSTLMGAADVVAVVLELTRQQTDILLCNNPDCHICPQRRRACR